MSRVRETSIKGGFGEFGETVVETKPKKQKREPFTVRGVARNQESFGRPSMAKAIYR